MSILKNAFSKISLLFLLVIAPAAIFCDNQTSLEDFGEELEQGIITPKKHFVWTYYLYVEEFIQSFIEIPTSNVLVDSTTISSRYLAGRASIYSVQDEVVGNCSASFLCMQNADNIYTDISNYLSVNNGLIISWFTPTTLLNLELDSIVHGMVTECIVEASTLIRFNPFYGEKFNMIVSSDNGKIYFKLTQI